MNDRASGCTSPLNLTLYFLAGGLTGACVALLLAPQSGRATREQMRRKLSDTAGSARELEDRLLRQARSIRDEARQRVGGAVSALAGAGEAKLAG